MIYLAEKDYKAAEKELTIHMNNHPEDTATYIQLASLHNEQGNKEQAANYYLKGLKIMPDNFQMKFGLASIRELQHKPDDAIRLYEEILKTQPDNAIATNNLAMILVNNKTDTASLNRARQLAEKFKSNKHVVHLDTLGWVYFKTGDSKNALKVLQHVVNKAPKIPVFNYHLGMVYHQLNNKELAKTHLKKALSLGPFQQKEEARKILESLN